MNKLLIVFISAICVYYGLFKFKGSESSQAPALAYRDTAGALHSFEPPCKPAAVVFWITPCAYCEHVLTALDSLRLLYPQDKLDVVGIFVNEGSTDQVTSWAKADNHTFTPVASRPGKDVALIQALDQYGFKFRAPGRAIYIVNQKCLYQKVDAHDLSVPSSQIAGDAMNLIESMTGLKPELNKPAGGKS